MSERNGRGTDYRLLAGPCTEVRQRVRYEYTAEEWAAVSALRARLAAWPRERGIVQVDLVAWDAMGRLVPTLEVVRRANEWLDELEAAMRPPG